MEQTAGQTVFLPIVAAPGGPAPTPLPAPQVGVTRLNIPFIEAPFPFAQAAVAWFGRVNQVENYADLRVGYTTEALEVRLQVFDHDLWYDHTPTPEEIPTWDGASLYLDAGSSTRYRFDGQLAWWEDRPGFQAAYTGGGGDWTAAALPFTTGSSWRGNAPNNDQPDNGWTLNFSIPFSSLGRTGRPTDGTEWGLAVVLHDRDGQADSPRPDQAWPAGADVQQPGGWGRLRFGGLPLYTPPPAAPSGTTTLRHNLDGLQVKDGMVGGSSTCGQGLDRWTEWGDAVHPGATQVNVQNQTDVADFPCFSKFYVTFPLESLPSGKVILSASLILHQVGNAGGGQWGSSPDSLIQISTIASDWEESSLSWNRAPLAVENVAQSWVTPISDWPGHPGVPWKWDLSRAVAQAYAAGQPLRLVLYSADLKVNSGKYFASADVGDWDAEARPTLDVVWGTP